MFSLIGGRGLRFRTIQKVYLYDDNHTAILVFEWISTKKRYTLITWQIINTDYSRQILVDTNALKAAVTVDSKLKLFHMHLGSQPDKN